MLPKRRRIRWVGALATPAAMLRPSTLKKVFIALLRPPFSRSGAGLWIVAIACAVIVLASLALVMVTNPSNVTGTTAPAPTPAVVTVDDTQWWDNSSSQLLATTLGFTTDGGQQEMVATSINYTVLTANQAPYVTVTSAVVETGGFQLVSSNLPVVIDDGTSQVVGVTVAVPNATYEGPLEIALFFSGG
jgi:hypothetical protein